MKILHVLNHSLPQLDGYAIRSANIVGFQAGLGLEPVVLTSARQEPVFAADRELIDGIAYYRTPRQALCPAPFLRQMHAVRKMAARIDHVVRIERPDILHAHSPCLWGQAAMRVAQRRGLPFVYEIRGLWEDAAVDQGKTRVTSWRYRMSRRLETRVAKGAQAVVTIAEHLRDELIQRGLPEERVFLVPNGVDAEKFRVRPPDRELSSALALDGCVCLGYVGSLYAWEGVDVLLRAMPRIIDGAPSARLLIVGGGAEEAHLRALINELGVARHVLFVGSVPHKDILRYYSILDILVYPRRRTRNTELVTPLKPLEAMAMEKAVLGSDVGGIRELFTEESAVLCRADDPADLAEKCLQLILCPDLRGSCGQHARAHALATRAWKAIIPGYLDVYRQALRSHAASKVRAEVAI